jgi:hypothetical protein
MEEVFGKVERGPFAVGSKSDRETTFINTDKGRFVLRLRDGDPFRDPAFDNVIGKTIRAKGVVTGYTFLVSDWMELKDDKT